MRSLLRFGLVLLVLGLTWPAFAADLLLPDSVVLYRGLGGRFFGFGVDRVGEMIRARCGADVTVKSWASASPADVKPGRRVVLIGHSMGAMAAANVSTQMKRVDVLITLDPPARSPGTVGRGVRRHVNYFQQQELLGRGVPAGSHRNVLVQAGHIELVDRVAAQVARAACGR